MKRGAQQAEMVSKLRGEMLSLEGYGRNQEKAPLRTGLGPIEAAFPKGSFPTGAVHEFLSPGPEQAAAASGFLAGLLSAFLNSGARCLWIGSSRLVFPPALKAFGLDPSNIIFIDLRTDREALWVIEEALKCPALPAVVGELRELSFTESRRLQLAVEQSGVTAFIHRRNPRSENTTACLSRWKIFPLPSAPEPGMPGVGYPRWQVSLLKARNGRPGSWPLEWGPQGFRHIAGLRTLSKHPFITQSA